MSLFTLFNLGIIESYKYQIVGNTSIIGIAFIGFLSNYRLKVIMFITYSIIIVSVGSVQSLISVVLVSLYYIYQYNKKIAIIGYSIALFFFLVFPWINELAAILYNTQSSNLEFTTLNRLASKLDTEIYGYEDYRKISAAILINTISISPQGYKFYDSQNYLEPHNYVLELLFTYGLLWGSIILIPMFYLLIKHIFFDQMFNSIKYALIGGVAPAMVSSGIHATRFFLIFLLAVVAVSANEKKS